MSELKPISIDAVEGALAKAERYRLLNEPREAESICRDVLEADPDNQEATATLVLALTDQFGKGFGNDVTGAQRLLQNIRSEYDRVYTSFLQISLPWLSVNEMVLGCSGLFIS